MKTLTSLRLFTLFGLLTLALHAAPIVTVDTLDDENDGVAAGGISLRDAISEVDSGGQILFHSSLSGGKIFLQHGSLLISGKSIDINASSLTEGIVIDGKTTQEGLTLFASAPIDHTISLTNLSFENCHSNGGAAISGAGLGPGRIALNLNDCLLAHNHSTGNGGAINTDGNFDLSLNRCSICWNSCEAEGGGGISTSSNLVATNCTIACNRSTGQGAAVYFSGGLSHFNHCTITGNTSTHATPSVIHGRVSSKIHFYHTICSGNPTPAIIRENSATLTSHGHNIFGSWDTFTPDPSSDILTNDPKLELPMRRGGHTFTCAFRPDSPACNAGDSNLIILGTPTTDQRGYPRFRDGVSGFFFDDTIDIGAYELGETITVTTAVDENFTFPDTGRSLREALVEAASNGPGTRITIDPAINELDTLTSELVINSDLWFDGASRPKNWVISRDPSGPGFRNLSVAAGVIATLESVTAEEGIATGSFGDSDGLGGGGVLVNSAAHLNLIDTNIADCRAENGGSGIGANGGGLLINESSAFLLRSSVAGCYADAQGGGIYVRGSLHAANSTILSNVAFSTGGGISDHADDEILLEHCTIYNNSNAPGSGGGLAVGATIPRIAYSIFSSNSPQNYSSSSANSPISLGINLEDGNGMFIGSGDILNTNPQLSFDDSFQRASRTPLLVPNSETSPAIDAGPTDQDYLLCYRTDQLGGPRIKSGIPNPIDFQTRLDLGAVEARRKIIVDTHLDENDGPDSGVGTSLRDAIFIANEFPDPDLIQFAPELCTPIQLKAAQGGELLLTTEITIQGAHESSFFNEIRGPRTDDPLSRFRVFHASGPAYTTLKFLTISDGHLDSGNGGGILNDNNGVLLMNRCVVKNCRAVNGGGIANTYSTSISGSSFYLNEASGDGGAVHISGTSAPSFNNGISSSTFWRNQAAGSGGAIHIPASIPFELTRLTISENSATGGGGISNTGSSNPLQVAGCIIANNQPDQFAGTAAEFSNLMTTAHPQFPGAMIADPLLKPLQDNGGATPTMALSDTSPAIDSYGGSTGGQRAIPNSDGNNDGTIRPDLGAFELGNIITVTTTADENGAPGDPETSLREAISAATPGTRIVIAPSLDGSPIVLNADLATSTSSLIHIIGNGTNLTTLINGGTDIEIRSQGYAEFRNLQFIGNVELKMTFPIGTLDFSRALVNECHFNGNSNYSPVTVFPCCHLQVVNSTFENITSSFGPLVTNGYTTLRQCTFANNNQPSGSGILVIDGESILEACTFRNLPSDLNGTAIVPFGGRTTIKHCVFDHPIGTTLIDASTYNGTVLSLGGNFSRNSESELNHPTDQVGDPKLSPLNGGLGSPPIYVPRIDSPLIDAISVTPKDALPSDPRGYRRPLDGNGDGFSFMDIGAVEAPPVILVDTEVDENDGIGNGAGTSLRDAVAVMNARNYAEMPVIGFAQHLDGLRIQLESGPGGEILLSAEQEINASALSNGITIAGSQSGGGGDYRVFQANASSENIRLIGLTIEQGFSTDWGGGLLVENSTACILTDCTVRDSFAAQAGGGIAVRNSSFLGLERTTLSENRCDQLGGGLSAEESFVQAVNSTISGNHAVDGGGGMADITLSDVSFEHCTIAENSSDNGGGGLDLDQASVRASHTILAKNTPINFFNRSPSGDITSLGYNLDDGTNGEFTQFSDRAAVPDAMIGALSNNGGRTQTHPLLYGSPAIDAGDPVFVSSGLLTTDQTGIRARAQDGDYLLPDTIDIGAFELDLSTLPPDMDFDCIPNGAEVAMGFNPQDPTDGLADQDGDLVPSGKEWLAGTNDFDRDSKFEMLSVTDFVGNLDEFEIVWSSVSNPDVTYDLELTEDGHNWILMEGGIPATGPVTIRNIPWISSTNNLLFRVKANRTSP